MHGVDDYTDVIVAGAGRAGLEVACALQPVDRVRVRLLAPGRDGFLRARAALGGRAVIVRDALDRVDPHARVAVTQDGAELSYDALVLAVGARAARSIPGAFTYRGPGDGPRLRAELELLLVRRSPAIVFAAGDDASALPALYDLALQASRWAEHAGVAASISVVTAGAPPAGDVVLRLAGAGVVLRPESVPASVEGDHLLLEGGSTLPADLVVSLPALRGRSLPGVPSNPAGFVEVDATGRVRGFGDVYAVGATTSPGPGSPQTVAHAIAVWAVGSGIAA